MQHDVHRNVLEKPLLEPKCRKLGKAIWWVLFRVAVHAVSVACDFISTAPIVMVNPISVSLPPICCSAMKRKL